MLEKKQIFISSVAADCDTVVEKDRLGIELAEYCTASNMDVEPDFITAAVGDHMQSTERFLFHAPFNELCPAAIEPLVVEITKKRYKQALKMAQSFHCEKMIVHTGYVPLVYYPEWFIQKSVEFWIGFLQENIGDTIICIENVLEDSHSIPLEIVKKVNDERLRLCVDIGHANVMKKEETVMDWITESEPWISHFHLHNNAGDWDTHDGLNEGTIPMDEIIRKICKMKNITVTLETLQSEESVDWLINQGMLEY